MDRAPDLTLRLSDHGFVSVLNAVQPVLHRREVVGTHRPEGVFIAGGPGVRSGELLPPMSILDVAPTLLYSLDLPVPGDLEEGHCLQRCSRNGSCGNAPLVSPPWREAATATGPR